MIILEMVLTNRFFKPVLNEVDQFNVDRGILTVGMTPFKLPLLSQSKWMVTLLAVLMIPLLIPQIINVNDAVEGAEVVDMNRDINVHTQDVCDH